MTPPPQESALDFQSWELELPLDYPRRDFLLAGIKEGFHIVNPEQITSQVEVDNYKSATDLKYANKVEKQILNELEHGHYKLVSEKPTIISALGAIPKRHSDKIRLIHDASRPSGSALNDFAPHNKFCYQSLQDAVDLIKPEFYLAKVDLANAYRSVRVHPSNFPATGLKWTFSGEDKPSFMVDTRLPFGARTSPEVFNQLTQAVRFMMANRGYNLVAYLDDFLIVAPTYKTCQAGLNTLMRLLRKLGFHLNYSKIEGPVQRLTFLGIVLDTLRMILELPSNKVQELYEELHSLSQHKKVTKLQLQKLAGRLNWATQCVYGGRYHMRRIIDASCKLQRPWHRTRLTRDMLADIHWWLHFLPTFNGCTPMIENRPAAPVSIDACNNAAGAFFLGDCVYTPWDNNTQDLCISYKEVLALEPAATCWAPYWSNKKVYVHSDNQAAVAIINKGSSKNSMVMDSLRRVFWLSAIYNFRLQAVYYPGPSNFLADAVSRLHEPGGVQRLQTLLSR